MSDVQLFIDGVWRDASGEGSGDVVNPASEKRIGRVSHASSADVAAAVRAAETALPQWRDATPAQRAAVLQGAAGVITQQCEAAAIALTREQGKTLAESRGELRRAVETFAWHAEAALQIDAPRCAGDKLIAVRPEPIGVVGAFTPWNYPAVIIARKLGAALAAGCSVVLKAAEETPFTAALIIRALEQAGLPRGVVNLVFGDPRMISAELLDSPATRAFSFTGSTVVGRQLAVRSASRLTRCVFELGGHAPVLVFADADIETAVRAIATYKFECAGQSCNAPSRIYVEASAYDRFLDAFTRTARSLTVGDGMDPSTDMGPMANSRRMDAMLRLVTDARVRGARTLAGGDRVQCAGYFWPPTVLTDVPDSAMIMVEEPFGPVIPILQFSTFDEAIARANATPYGLAAYVFTTSDDTACSAARGLAAGSVGINELRGVPADVGIAGIKDSGYGYEGGWAGVDAFLNLKVVRGQAAGAAAE